MRKHIQQKPAKIPRSNPKANMHPLFRDSNKKKKKKRSTSRHEAHQRLPIDFKRRSNFTDNKKSVDATYHLLGHSSKFKPVHSSFNRTPKSTGKVAKKSPLHSNEKGSRVYKYVKEKLSKVK